MSNRSYPADFSRPLREVPVTTDQDVQRMLERLRRRCKAGKVSVNDGSSSSGAVRDVDDSGGLGDRQIQCRGSSDLQPALSVHDSSGELREPNLHQAQLPDGAKPSPPAVSKVDAASSAGVTAPVGRLHVSATAEITACAGGGSTGASALTGIPFQPTRSVGPGSGCEVDADASIASAVPVLIWERINPTAMRTTCGTWTCCKVILGGQPSYELWRRIGGLERPVPVLHPFKSFADASQAAQDEMDRCD